MKGKRKWFLALFLMLATLTWAQGTITVSGQVTDQQNEPLIGVTVLIDGQQAGGTVTDFDGNYTIKAPAKATLKFSYTGVFASPRSLLTMITVSSVMVMSISSAICAAVL